MHLLRSLYIIIIIQDDQINLGNEQAKELGKQEEIKTSLNLSHLHYTLAMAVPLQLPSAVSTTQSELIMYIDLLEKKTTIDYHPPLISPRP